MREQEKHNRGAAWKGITLIGDIVDKTAGGEALIEGDG